jgi:hypothetical protein
MHHLVGLVTFALLLSPLEAGAQDFALQGSAVSSSAAEMAETPGLKSASTAFWFSFLSTAVPASVGAWDVFRSGSSDSVVPGIMLVAAGLFGPSVGHFYAGRPGPAWVGIGIRTVAGLGIAVAAAEQLGEGTEYTLEWLAVAGAFLGGASVVWDIATAPHSAHVHNDKIRREHATVGIAPSFGAAGPGLCAVVTF